MKLHVSEDYDKLVGKRVIFIFFFNIALNLSN